MDELLEYKDEVVSSCLFVQYQLFLLYASEMNSQINISLAEVEAYYSYMDDSQREYFNLFRLSSGNMELSDNEEWIFIRRLKAKANLYAYQKNTFAAYDLCISIVFFNLFNIYFYHIKYAKNPLFMGFFLILPLRILFINVINCSLLI